MTTLMSATAFAGNVTDTDYYKENAKAGTWTSTSGRYKEDASKVYVHPESSPSGKTKVQTDCYVGGFASNETKNGSVVLQDGAKYGITNYVYENGDHNKVYGVLMWLALTPDSGSGVLSGVWSPDWTGSGSVTIV